MAASVEEFIELLSSEQYIDIGRLRHLARHGVHPSVRGEVWMYLLGVLSSDKSQEMTTVRHLYNTYDALLSHSIVDVEVQAAIAAEAQRLWRTRVPHPAPAQSQTNVNGFITPVSKGSSSARKSNQVRKRTPVGTIKPMDLEAALGSTVIATSGSGDYLPPKTGQASHSQVGEQAHAESQLDGFNDVEGDAVEEDDPSPGRKEYDLLQQAFVKRLCNVVRVWIAQVAQQHADAAQLRRRLEGEELRRAQRDAPAESSAPQRFLTVTNKHGEAYHQSAAGTSSPRAGEREDRLDHENSRWGMSSPVVYTSSSSSSSASSSPPQTASFRSETAIRARSDQPAYLAKQLAQENHAELQDEDVRDESCDEEGRGENRVDPDEDDDHPAFDPAMGMGIEEDTMELESLESSAEARPHWDRRERRDFVLRSGPSSSSSPLRRSPATSSTASPRSRSKARRQKRSYAREHLGSSTDGDGISSRKAIHRDSSTSESVLEPVRSYHHLDNVDKEDDYGDRPEVTFNVDRSVPSDSFEGKSTAGSSRAVQATEHNPDHLFRSEKHQSTPLKTNDSQTERSGCESPLRYSTTKLRSRRRKHTRISRSRESLDEPNSSSDESLSSNSDRHEEESDDGDDDDDDDDQEDESRDHLDDTLIAVQRRLFNAHLVHLAAPFVMVSLNKRVEAGVYFAFHKLMELMRPPAGPDLAQQLAIFHSLFRRTLPELKAYFDEEGLDVTPFVATWLRGLFAGGGMVLDMRGSEGRSGVLRLWDAYFARINDPHMHQVATPTEGTEVIGTHHGSTSDDASDSEEESQHERDSRRGAQSGAAERPGKSEGPTSSEPTRSSPLDSVIQDPDDHEPHSLHLYVCLAVLLHCKDVLEELDRSECESFLRGLPQLDVDKILSEALNLRLSHKQAAAFNRARIPTLQSLLAPTGEVAKESEDASQGNGDGADASGNDDEEALASRPANGARQGTSTNASRDKNVEHTGPRQGKIDVRNLDRPGSRSLEDLPLSLLPSEGDIDACLERTLFKLDIR